MLYVEQEAPSNRTLNVNAGRNHLNILEAKIWSSLILGGIF